MIDLPVKTWLDAARKGSLEALGWAFEAYRPYLDQTAKQWLGADLVVKEDVTDVVQETFLEAFRDFDQFHGNDQAEWKSWLRQILLHNLSHLQRRYRGTGKRLLKREVPLAVLQGAGGGGGFDLKDDTTSPSGHAMRNEGNDKLRRVIERLPVLEREAYLLRAERGLTFEEMGRELKVTAVTARNRWLNATNRLWDQLGLSSRGR
ncbi:sigma-70 family RNA polymerase sigma factor [Singulisphaera rosea]